MATNKKSALQGAQLTNVYDLNKQVVEYRKTEINTILSICDAIQQNKFTPREVEFLNYLIDQGKTLRKPAELKCYKNPYTPSLLQHLNPKLKAICNMNVKSSPVSDGSGRKYYFLAVCRGA